MWALPGGKTDTGESLAGCGIRGTYEVAWFAPAEADGLPMVASIRKRPADWRSGANPVVR